MGGLLDPSQLRTKSLMLLINYKIVSLYSYSDYTRNELNSLCLGEINFIFEPKLWYTHNETWLILKTTSEKSHANVLLSSLPENWNQNS